MNSSASSQLERQPGLKGSTDARSPEMTHTAHPYALLDADDSLLIAIDVQDAFLDKMPGEERERLLKNICWLIAVARWKQVPLLVTAEELPGQPLAPGLVACLPAGTPVFDKKVFGLADQADILLALEGTGRNTVILAGLETDVCVAHSALGLLERGYRVAVVADATGTPAPNQAIGISRMQSAGAIIVSLKGLFYEWLRTVEEVNRFHQELPHMRSLAGIVL
jgi:nicotinamidase-related amidase